jgi:subtilisin family serine protease
MNHIQKNKSILKIFSILLGFGFVLSQVTEGGYQQRSQHGQNRSQSASSMQGEYVPGEVLVKYKNTVDNTVANSNSKNFGYRIKKKILNKETNRGAFHLLGADKNADIFSVIETLKQNSDVEYAQPNYIYRAMTNDTNYSDLWALKNTGQSVTAATYTGNPGTAGKDIDVETAWGLQSDCSSVVVAVIDSGVKYDQADLVNNMVNGSYTCPTGTGIYGCDFVDGDNDPMDLNGHGTHVSGIIGAEGNNSQGITGVCQTAQILAVRVLDAAGSGTTTGIIAGLDFAAGTASGQGNAKIINMSLGGGGYDYALETSITNAASNGVVVVAAAGNSGLDHTYYPSIPCDYPNPNIICVAAANQSYAMAAFSDYDAHPDTAARKVDVGAPGTNILSAYIQEETAISNSMDSTFTGWTFSGGWGYELCNGFSSPVPLIQNPSSVGNTWCDWGTAGNSINGAAFGIYDLLGLTYDKLMWEFGASVDLTSSGDSFEIFYKSTGGDPSLGGTSLYSAAGPSHTDGALGYHGYDLKTICETVNCSLGFQYITDTLTNTTYDSVAVAFMTITGITNSLFAYKIENGTSMATPVVAGIAALLFSHNPGYDYIDVVEAVIYGGDTETSMSDKTKSGMVVDAYKALKYLPAPRNVTLTVQ